MNVSIAKKRGTPVPKSPNVIFIKVGDIATDVSGNFTGFPARAADGIASAGNIALKVGAKALALYMTPSTIARNDNSDGEGSGIGSISNFVGEHPGDDIAINQFLQEYMDEDVLIISRECASTDGTRLQGSPCNPMKMSFESQDNNEAKKKIITFKQDQRDSQLMMHYSGTTPDLLPYVDESSSSGSGL